MPLSDPLSPLRDLDDLRVWSVVITFFGDAVRPPAGWVPASALGAVGERVAIAAPALRVALHRLVRDGWLQRARLGRRSYYALSDSALAEAGPAAARIYAPAPALTGPWRLAAGSGGRDPALEAEMAAAGWIDLAPGLWLGHGASPDAPDSVIRVGGQIATLPDWARRALCPEAVVAGYRALERALEAVAQAVATQPPTPLDAVALRILAVHHWRRLVLRHPDLPPEFFAQGWPGETCRVRFLHLHAALSPAASVWIAEALAGVQALELSAETGKKAEISRASRPAAPG